jgi:hypothetical protein
LARNKYPEITKQRILEVSTKLFLENGWEETTIQDIVDELGDITRGAFYHHFKSKDDIIDAVTTSLFSADSPIEKVKKEKNLNGMEKLKSVLLLSLRNEEEIKFAKSAPTVLRSPIFIGKQMKSCVNYLAANLQSYLEEGIQDGSINVQYPKQVAETFLILCNQWLNPILFPVSKEEYMKKFLHFKQLYDGIGLYIMDDEFEKVYESYYDFLTN